MSLFQRLLITLTTILWSINSYASDTSQIICYGAGCDVSNLLLNNYNITTNQILQILDDGFVNDIRHSLDQNIINKNSIQLSLPYKINGFAYTLDLNGFYLRSESWGLVAGNPFGYEYWFAGCVPRLTIGYPILDSLELWLSMNYFKGPSDMWLNIYDGHSTLEYTNFAMELKALLLETKAITANFIIQGNTSSEVMRTSTTLKDIKILKINWFGNEEIQYESMILTFPTVLQLATTLGKFSAAVAGGAVMGSLTRSDSFARNGILGPAFGESGYFRLNVSSSKQYNIGFLQPIFGLYSSYMLSDNVSVGLGIQPSLDLSGGTVSLRIVVLN